MELFTKRDLAEGELQSLKTRRVGLKPVAPPPQPPAIDRRRVVLRERSRWRELRFWPSAGSAKPHHAACTRRVCAAGLAPTSAQVVT
jgi:hypothetical protein